MILNLAKNPAGFNQNISAVMEDSKPKDIIVLINDNDQDGIDVSWLWDVDFDRFADINASSITVCGIRCQDMRLRLKYVDIPSDLEPDVEKAIRQTGKRRGESVRAGKLYRPLQHPQHFEEDRGGAS